MYALLSTRFSVQYIVAAAGHAMEEVRVAWPEEVRRATVAVKRGAGWLAHISCLHIEHDHVLHCMECRKKRT